MPVDYFVVAMEHVFEWEGGEVNDPRDPGGHTKFGISKRSYPHLTSAHSPVRKPSRYTGRITGSCVSATNYLAPWHSWSLTLQ